MSDTDDQVTPTLEEVILMGVDYRLLDMHTSCPGIVQSYDPATQTASVQPCLQRTYPDNTTANLPVINSVPVMFPSSSIASITFPISQGDYVWLVFSERSIDIWKSTGGIVDPMDSRKFNLSDCVAYPGTRSKANPISGASATDLVIKVGNSTLMINKSGKFTFSGAGGEDVLKILSDTCKELSIAQTAMGPLLDASNFAALQQRIDGLRE